MKRMKRTRKAKRTETFVNIYHMSPQEFIGKFKTLPNYLRKKVIIQEAQALV